MTYQVQDQDLLDGFQSDDPTSCESELALLRFLLQNELQNPKRSSRLCADLAATIGKMAAQVEQSQIRKRQLIPLTTVAQICSRLCAIVHEEIDNSSLDDAECIRVVEAIAWKAREAAHELNAPVPQLEDQTHDNR